MHVFSTQRIKSRKPHYCDGFGQLLNYAGSKVPNHSCSGVGKGDIYVREKGIDGGCFYTFDSCVPCNELIVKHKAYDPWA